MRRIDLFCKLAGPLFIALVDGASRDAAIFLTLALNVTSVPIEYFAIAQVSSRYQSFRSVDSETQKVYHAVPQLQVPKPRSLSGTHDQSATSTASRSCRVSLEQLLAPLKDFKLYSGHSAFLPSFSLSLLYFTVLSMSGQQITYLVSVGYSAFAIGLVRTLSTVFELTATWIAPRLMRKIGAARTGMWFLNWQTAWLGGAVSFFWAVKRPIVAASGLVAGTILSRIGLWGYDLSAQYIIQQVNAKLWCWTSMACQTDTSSRKFEAPNAAPFPPPKHHCRIFSSFFRTLRPSSGRLLGSSDTQSY